VKERDREKRQPKILSKKNTQEAQSESLFPHLGYHLAGGEFNPDLERKTENLGSPIGRHLAGGDFNPDLEPADDLGSSIGRHLAGEDL
jgi:hypothetical protein